MSMLFGKVTIPDTTGDMSVKAIPIASVGGVTAGSINVPNNASARWNMTGYTTMCSLVGTAYVLCWPDANTDDNATWPTAQDVVDYGMPATSTLPFYLQDWAGSPFPDARLYFVAKADGAGDLRVGS